jgi:subtilisin family serine protease
LPSFGSFSARQVGQHVYDSAGFVGFSAMLSADEAARLANDAEVQYVEEDQVISLDRNMPRDANIDVPTWGCDRADQRALPLDHIYRLPLQKSEAVAIPNVYVVDTGIYTKHVEFEGRASMAANFIKDGKDDCNGHGTHVAGTVGGVSTGIIPYANLFGVRVLDCGGSGTYANVIAGIDFVTKNAIKPAVMTMSLGGGYSKAINDATAATIASGITTTVASGNENQDACRVSPASTPGAIVVNSANVKDAASSFSNWGKCTTIFAPGEAVTSAWYTGPTDYKTISGTSMATPHVAGNAALYLARKPAASPSEINDAIICASTLGTITGVKANTPNRFFYLNNVTMASCLP